MNAGPRRRYTANNKLVFNCDLGLGYQMGPPKFKDTLAKGPMGGDPVNFSLAKCREIVYDVWRAMHPQIVNGWRYLQNVIIPNMARKDLVPYRYRCLVVEPQRLRLPNGLYLNFPGLRPIDHPDGGYEYWNGKYWKSLYGGLLAENIIQALARIVMGEMMIEIGKRISQYSAKVILTVHDEIIVNSPSEHAETCFQIMLEVMSQPPAWCNDGSLALAAEGGWARPGRAAARGWRCRRGARPLRRGCALPPPPGDRKSVV